MPLVQNWFAQYQTSHLESVGIPKTRIPHTKLVTRHPKCLQNRGTMSPLQQKSPESMTNVLGTLAKFQLQQGPMGMGYSVLGYKYLVRICISYPKYTI